MKHLGEILAYAFTIALGIVLTVNLSIILGWGGVTMYESNRAAVGLEIALGVGILCFGLGSLVNLILKERRKRRHES